MTVSAQECGMEARPADLYLLEELSMGSWVMVLGLK
eukprot:CAMPEP_0117811900 /NCGR_PEP_ID=MMETSP0948-20121206/22434_1 /TAXON_ID=44440 /ORGANISM="Chattonella subsalsa, Strain CCMP2191" /LENGTH=35 /DNA_ID= /DNA_START= /DNA_END= /DNA_ORIENTATION=